MKFKPENQLEKAFIAGATDPTKRRTFYQLLLDSELYFVPHSDSRVDGRELAAQEIQVRFIEHNGQPWIPVFSSTTRVNTFLAEIGSGDENVARMNGRGLMEATKGMNLMLNPGSEYTKELPQAEISSLLDGSLLKPTGDRMAPGTQVNLRPHPDVPAELTDVLKRYFGGQKKVTTAWVAQMYVPEQDAAPHMLIGVAADDDFAEISAGAMLALGSVTIPDPPVDFMQITDSSDFAAFFRKECTPFYRKKRFGIF